MRRLPAVVALAAVLAAAGCGVVVGTRAPVAPGGTLTVLAAASLTESFTRIGKDFETAHPGVEVVFSFGGSSGLAQQIVAGAPADVFAAASPATMRTVTGAGAAAGPPVVFARNQLVIAVPRGNPQRIARPADLARPGVKVALCAEQVPCGEAAGKALAGLSVTPVTRERDVKAALAKVRLGEVDAALVYRTDVRAATGVEGVEFAESAQAINDYPVVALTDGATAAAFVAYVRSGPALAVLTDAGFQKP